MGLSCEIFALNYLEKKEKLKKLKKEFIKKFILFNFSREIKVESSLVYNKSSSIHSLLRNCVFFLHNGNVFRRLVLLHFFVCLKFSHFVFCKKPFKYLIRKKKR